jgi:hypothetical protein
MSDMLLVKHILTDDQLCAAPASKNKTRTRTQECAAGCKTPNLVPDPAPRMGVRTSTT